MITKAKKTISVKSRDTWRKWLEKNHARENSVWLVVKNKGSKARGVTVEEGVEEALCYGWIDSLAHKLNAQSFLLTFSPRKPKSKWSSINRQRVGRLIESGRMTESGQKMIVLAKETGTWETDNSTVPLDFEKVLNKNKKARLNFEAFPPSSKRIILDWILSAKKPETRQKRIDETLKLAAENVRAHHYQK